MLRQQRICLNACSDCRRLDIEQRVHNEISRLKILEPLNIQIVIAVSFRYNKRCKSLWKNVEPHSSIKT